MIFGCERINMKNLTLAFCSFKPNQINKEFHKQREIEYGICLEQLKRILPQSYDIFIIDNTSTALENINNVRLRNLVATEKHLLINRNLGEGNKGVGEIDMLKEASRHFENFNKYDCVTYVTARRFFTCPYYFERTEMLKKDALLCNPDFVDLVDGNLHVTEKRGMYNDMIFSMKKDTILKYIDYSNLDHMIKNRIGSEQNLYNFITENKIEYEWVNWIGQIRNDWERNNKIDDLNNYHVC